MSTVIIVSTTKYTRRTVTYDLWYLNQEQQSTAHDSHVRMLSASHCCAIKLSSGQSVTGLFDCAHKNFMDTASQAGK